MFKPNPLSPINDPADPRVRNPENNSLVSRPIKPKSSPVGGASEPYGQDLNNYIPKPPVPQPETEMDPGIDEPGQSPPPQAGQPKESALSRFRNFFKNRKKKKNPAQKIKEAVDKNRKRAQKLGKVLRWLWRLFSIIVDLAIHYWYVTLTLLFVAVIFLLVRRIIDTVTNDNKSGSGTSQDGTISYEIKPAAANGENGWYTQLPTINLNSDKSVYYYFNKSSNVKTYDGKVVVPEGDNTLFYYTSADSVSSLKLKVDLAPPSNPNKFIENMDDDLVDKDKTCTKKLKYKWDKSADGVSGLAGYVMFVMKEIDPDSHKLEMAIDKFKVPPSRTNYELTDKQAAYLDDGKYFGALTAKDMAGNETKVNYSTGIEIITTGPENPKVVINDGAERTADVNVKLKLSVDVDDEFKPVRMKITNHKEDLEDPEDADEDDAGTPDTGGDSDSDSDSEAKLNITNKALAADDSDEAADTDPDADTSEDDEVTGDTGSDSDEYEDDTKNWPEFAEEVDWVLDSSEGDGFKKVYVQFADKCGNKSHVTYDEIFLDNTPPQDLQFQINSNAERTSDKNVTLGIRASDDWTPIKMMISNNSSFDGNINTTTDWIDFVNVYSWQLTDGDGPKTVYIKYKDGGDNTTEPISDDIILDTTGPTGAIAINNGAGETSSVSIRLFLSYSDPWTPIMMKVSNNLAFNPSVSNTTDWMPAMPVFNWGFSNNIAGNKRVFIQFRDGGGNLSQIYFDDITYTPPPPPPDDGG